MNVFTICGLALIAAVLSLLFKQYKPEYRIVLSVIAICLLFVAVSVYIKPLKDTVEELFYSSGTSYSLLKILYKSLAVTYISGLTADICNDSGEHALSENVLLIGKITVIYIALPLISETIKIIGSLTSL